MDDDEQLLGEDDEYLAPESPEPACLCILLLDTSGSMRAGNRLEQLADGVRLLQEDIRRDPVASKRVELLVISFGAEVIAHDRFAGIYQFEYPSLKAGGATPMGEAILTALERIERRKEHLRLVGRQYYRPWIFLITDGKPGGPGELPDPHFDTAVQRVCRAQERNKVVLFSVMIDESLSLEYLERLSVEAPRYLKPGMWKDMFLWLSSSLTQWSNGDVSDSIPRPAFGKAQLPWAL